MRPRVRFVIPPIAALLCCAWIGSILAGENNSSYRAALESIRADALLDDVGQLAGPDMEGREAGTRGGHAAGEYLAGQYARLRLRGAGDEGGFFQPFAPNFRNILSMLRGGDARLRDEVIVVCAHYDHIGYGENGLSRIGPGYLHPGADDNASGTSAVLELAKAMMLLATPPKRSILFAAWDAEEKGLLGSRHWTSHPTVPLDRVVAAINLDMVGRLHDRRLTVFASRSAAGWRRLVSFENRNAGLLLDFSWSLERSADHAPFFEHGIPVLLFHTGLHDEYHRPNDTAKLINGDGMADITRLLFGVVHELANRPASLPFRDAASQESPETEAAIVEETPKPVDRLGVEWIDSAASAGGILVSQVEPDSPADRAGVRPGDRITRVAGRDIRSDEDFYSALSVAPITITCVLVRADEKEPATVRVSLRGEPVRWGIQWRADAAEPGAIILTHVTPGTPAAWAGLKPGDRIYQVAGRDFVDEAAFLRLVDSAGEAMPLLVERSGRVRTVVLHVRRVAPLKRAA